VYTKTWTRVASTGTLGGYVKTTSTQGATVTLRFTGSAFRFAGTTRAAGNIYVDGVLKGALSPDTETYSWPASAKHTIKIVAAGGPLDVDAFAVLG
jgi:hypothetical protein